jgi:glycosyltransferase involved in cell wall biosynthesis
MKIVFLAPFGIRPKGTVIARMLPLAVQLQKSGHTVVIVAPPYTNPEDSGRTELVRGVRLVNVALPAVGRALSAPMLTWRMFRAALAEKPDLVHLFKPKGYGGLAAMLMIVLRRLGLRLPPLFVDTDDWEGRGGMNDLHAYSGAEKRLFILQEEWLSRRAAGVTAASRTLEELTRSLGLAPERILYLPNCVEEAPPGDGSRVRDKLGLGRDMPVVLLYTRFFEFSQDRLHRVLAEVYRRVPEVRFLVVGKGRHGEEAGLLSAARDMGFAAAVVTTGWVEPRDIPDYLAAADVAIYPLDDTLVNRAKCPAKLTEVMAAGVPVVADRVGQAGEYIRSGVSGILCDPEHGGEMAERVAELLGSPERRRLMGQAGREELLAHYRWDMWVELLAAFYRRLVRDI